MHFGPPSFLRRFRSHFSLQRFPRIWLIWRGVKAVIIAGAILAVLIVVVTRLVGGLSLTEPGTATAVLASVPTEDPYEYSVQIVHTIKAADGSHSTSEFFQSVSVDQTTNRFQVFLVGTLPEAVAVDSDGKLTAFKTSSDQAAGLPWRKLNDVCAGQPALPASLVALPWSSAIRQAQPKLLSSTASYLSLQSWLLSFQPSPQLLSQYMLLPFLARAFPRSFYWVMAQSDLQELAKGQVTIDGARAWVLRSSHALTQVDLRFHDASGASWHVVVQYYPVPQGQNPLAGVNFHTVQACRGQ